MGEYEEAKEDLAVTESNVNKLFDEVEKVTRRKEMDLSADADLSVAIMNLINLEEHLFFTAVETGKDDYYGLMQEVRGMRIALLKEIVKDYEGEVWCISKHLLAASMRIMETGTKQLEEGNKERAKALFEKSYRLYLLLWEINSRIIYPTPAKVQTAVSEKGIDEEKQGEETSTQEAREKEKVVFVPVCKESL